VGKISKGNLIKSKYVLFVSDLFQTEIIQANRLDPTFYRDKGEGGFTY